MKMTDAATKGLRQFIEDERPKAEAGDNVLRSEGARAKADGVPIVGCPHRIGSYMSIRWLEGWSDTRAPRRNYLGERFNMTPQQDIERFADWIMSLALPDDCAARAIELHRAGYRVDVHPTLN